MASAPERWWPGCAEPQHAVAAPNEATYVTVYDTKREAIQDWNAMEREVGNHRRRRMYQIVGGMADHPIADTSKYVPADWTTT